MEVHGIEHAALARPARRLDDVRACCTSLLGLHDLVGKLQGAGCTAQHAAPLGGRERFFTRDPFGNKLELVAFPA